MTKRTKRNLILAGAVALLTILLAGYLLVRSEWPGGMRSNYTVRDYDTRLTREAATAMPIITALNRYHNKHSVFPTNATDFVSYFPSPPAPLAAGGEDILGWFYTQTGNGSGYELWRKLGWDPSLQYHYDGSQGRWVFDPGDGSGTRTVILKP